MKNNIVSDFKDRIIYLSDTYEGSMHDKKICDEENLEKIKGVELWKDSGYEGFNPENANTVQPTKKKKGKELSETDKLNNKEISRKRVYVEHTMRGIKIFRILSELIRNYLYGFKDTAIEICCGLHNFIVSCRPEKKQPIFD